MTFLTLRHSVAGGPCSLDHSHWFPVTDSNELEIVRCHGLDPIVGGSALAADGLMMNDMKSDKEVALLEELGTQCARALRNLSVNRKLAPCVSCCPGTCHTTCGTKCRFIVNATSVPSLRGRIVYR
jgi:hypothetical protein